MPYLNEGIDQRAEVLQGPGVDALVYWARLGGQPAAPTAAFVTILGPAGDVLVARAAAAYDAVTGRISVSQAWPLETYPTAEDYCALVEWTAGGVEYSDRLYFDVVKSKLLCPLAASDLLDAYPDLEGRLRALGSGVTVDRFIRLAWSELLDRIRASGHRPSLIIDRQRLVNPARRLALAQACDACIKEPGDVWSQRADRNHRTFDQLAGALGQLRYDDDEDAVASPEETSRINRKGWTV